MGLLKKSELHLSKYTVFSRQFDYMKYFSRQFDYMKYFSRQFDYMKYDKKLIIKRLEKKEKTMGIEPDFRELKGMPKFKAKKTIIFHIEHITKLKYSGEQ